MFPFNPHCLDLKLWYQKAIHLLNFHKTDQDNMWEKKLNKCYVNCKQLRLLD